MQQSFYEQTPAKIAATPTIAAPKKTKQTALNLLYHLLAFPVGTICFVLIITGLSVGVGTMIIWIGIPILFVTVLMMWQLAAFERQLTIEWLNVDIPPMAFRPAAQPNWWKMVVARITHPVTWKSFIYFMVKFPFSVFAFSLTVTLVVTSIALILSPAIYLADTFLLTLGAYPAHTISAIVVGHMNYTILVDGQVRINDLIELFIGSGIGIVLWFATRYVINGMAFIWGQFARVMLGMHENWMYAPEPKMSDGIEREPAMYSGYAPQRAMPVDRERR